MGWFWWTSKEPGYSPFTWVSSKNRKESWVKMSGILKRAGLLQNLVCGEECLDKLDMKMKLLIATCVMWLNLQHISSARIMYAGFWLEVRRKTLQGCVTNYQKA